MASELEVENFLGRFRTAVQLRTGKAQWKNREKNRHGLAKFGLTEETATKLIVKELCAANYAAGPKPDDTDPSKEVWEFGIVVAGIEAYVKIRLDEQRDRHAIPYVWSFHPAERPIAYQLKTSATKGGE